MLKTRIYTVMVLLPLFVAGLFYLPVSGWALFLAPLMLIGAWEWGALALWGVAGRSIFVCVIAVGGALLWQLGSGTAAKVPALIPLLLGVTLLFWIVVVPLWLAYNWRMRSTPVLAITGAILLLPLWCALIQLQARPGQLLMLMAIVWISDTTAYLCGRRWGRRKLAASISPGKTWEGVVGALLAVALYYGLISVATLAEYDMLRGFSGFGIFMFLAVLGIEGDLFESWIKRTAGVKDSGAVFPGHGGVLDRIDALTASLPVAALFLSGVVG